MKSIKYLERLKKTHKLIKQRNTGTPKEFAKKLDISERSFFSVLDYLREIDASICYDKKGFTYYYSTDFNLEINISINVLKKDETIKIYGGQSFLQKNSRLPSFGTVQTYL